MNVHVLSEEDVNHIEDFWHEFSPHFSTDVVEDVLCLIATIRDLQAERDMYKQQMEYWRSSSDQFADTIRDRDRQIKELTSQRNHALSDANSQYETVLELEQQNQLILSALEQIATYNDGADALEDLEACQDIARDTIAQVKALTVSKQEESAEDGDAN